MEDYFDVLKNKHNKSNKPSHFNIGRLTYTNGFDGKKLHLKALIPLKESPSLAFIGDSGKCELQIRNLVYHFISEVQPTSYKFAVIDFNLNSPFDFLRNLSLAHRLTFVRNEDDLKNWLTSTHHEIDQQKDFSTKCKEKPVTLCFVNFINLELDKRRYQKSKQLLLSGAKYGYHFLCYSDSDSGKARSNNKNIISQQMPFNLQLFNDFTKHFTYITLNSNSSKLFNLPSPKLKQVYDLYEYKIPSYNANEYQGVSSALSQHINSQQAKHSFLRVPIGKVGNSDFYFEFSDGTQCYHAFLGGQTGTGKTNLINEIIHQIAKNYSSDEWRLFLMDYKEGVEFQQFEDHPNVQQLYLNNQDCEAANKLLRSFKEEIEKRKELFLNLSKQKHNTLNNIITYNKYSKKPLPRNLLVIDEVQQLLSGDYKRVKAFKSLLSDVARRGRSFGIHLLLSTQTLHSVDFPPELKSQIKIRLTFRLSDSTESWKILSAHNEAPLQLKNYELLYNANSGHLEDNQIIKTTKFSFDDYKSSIKLAEKKFTPEVSFKKEIYE